MFSMRLTFKQDRREETLTNKRPVASNVKTVSCVRIYENLLGTSRTLLVLFCLFRIEYPKIFQQRSYTFATPA